MPGLFELTLPDGEPVGLVGPWQAAAPASVSFEAGAEPPAPEVPVWSVNLPADEDEAERALAEAEAQVAAAAAALAQVPARLEELTSAQPRSGGVSFDVTSFSVDPGSPEAEMLSLMEHAQALEKGGGVSYGIKDFASQAWEQARDQFETFVQQLEREVLNLAWVETKVEMQLRARSVVGWSGDNNTIWLADLEAQEIDVHRRAVQVAVKSRLLRIRMFTTVTGGAARLSLLLATPAGAVLALPAAWKYVTEILQQIKTYQTLTQGG